MTEVYEIGGRRLGVRWSRGGLDVELRALAANALGVGDAPANISIVLGETTGRARSKHQVHVQGHLTSMVSGDGGLIRAVIRALGTLAAESSSGSLTLNALLLLDPGGAAVVVDRRLAADVRRLGSPLRHGGWRMLQLPHFDVRPDKAVALLPEAAAAVGVSLADLTARWPLKPGDDDLATGEVAITGFVYAGRPEPESRADAVADLLGMLRDPTGRVRSAEVAQLADLAGRLRLGGVAVGDRSRLARLLEPS